MCTRREAVELAKRSVAYNCGSDNSRVRVVNRDFRWIYHKKHSNSTRGDTEGSVDITEDAGFRVFAAVVSFSLNKKAVQSYII